MGCETMPADVSGWHDHDYVVVPKIRGTSLEVPRIGAKENLGVYTEVSLCRETTM